MISELLVALGLMTAPFTDEELNACAATAAYEDALGHGFTPENAAAEMVLEGYTNIVEMARGYQRRWGVRTVYSEWVDRGMEICAKLRGEGKPIEMPEYRLPAGYHIVRGPGGSGAIVKDGDVEPTFSCAEGYYDSGRPWSPDGGGCVAKQ